MLKAYLKLTEYFLLRYGSIFSYISKWGTLDSCPPCNWGTLFHPLVCFVPGIYPVLKCFFLNAILQSHVCSCHLGTHQVLKSLCKKYNPKQNSVLLEENNIEHPKFYAELSIQYVTVPSVMIVFRHNNARTRQVSESWAPESLPSSLSTPHISSAPGTIISVLFNCSES